MSLWVINDFRPARSTLNIISSVFLIQAHMACQADDGELLKVDDRAFWDDLRDEPQFTQHTSKKFWIGARSYVWRWTGRFEGNSDLRGMVHFGTNDEI